MADFESEKGLTRRELIVAGAAVTGGLILTGCGGGGAGGSQTVTSVASTKTTVTFALPGGVAPANLLLITGFSSATNLKGSVSAVVAADYVSSCVVFDTKAGKLVMAGMIDPSQASTTINAANVAATLIFLNIGGSQLSTTLRNALWKLVAADPATATFATVVGARLSVNPYALSANDAQLSAGLTTAVGSLQSATLAATDPPLTTPNLVRVARPAATTLPPTPSPQVNIIFTLFSEAQGAHYVDATGETYGDYFCILNQRNFEAAYFVYDVKHVGTNTTAVSPPGLLTGPNSVPWPTTQYIRSAPETVPLASATDSERIFNLVYLCPFFEFPTPPAFSNPAYDASQIATWKATLAGLYSRSALRLANCLFLEAMGLGGAEYTPDQLMAQYNQLISFGGAPAAALNSAASGGVPLAAVYNIVSALTTNVTNVYHLLASLEPIMRVPIPYSQNRYDQLSSIIGMWGAYQLYAKYGRIFQDLSGAIITSGSSFDTDDIVVGTSNLVTYTLAPDPPVYTAGGPGSTLTLSNSTGGENNLFQYQWKLSGSKGSTLQASGGKPGTTITTTTPAVTLNTPSTATGVQSVLVTIQNVESGSPVLAGTAKVNLDPATSDAYTMQSASTVIEPASTVAVYVGDANGDINIDLTNLSFEWVLAANIGLAIVNGTESVSSLTTTTNKIQIKATPTAEDSLVSNLQVTVRKVDPSTGDFTNLAVLKGTVTVDVRVNCSETINPVNFAASQLLTVFGDYLIQVNENVTSTASGFTFSGIWGGNGQDYMQISFTADSEASDPQLTNCIVTLRQAGNFEPFEGSTTQGTLEELPGGTASAGDFVGAKYQLTTTVTDSNDGRQVQLTYIFGFGNPPAGSANGPAKVRKART